MSYGGSSQTIVNIRENPLAKPASEQTAPAGSSPARQQGEQKHNISQTANETAFPLTKEGKPDFDRMTPEQRLQYHLFRLTKKFG